MPVPYSCGDLSYAITYDGTAVDTDDLPFAQSDPDSFEITINSDLTTLIDDTVSYEITATFAGYSSGQSAKKADIVSYISPCLNPTTFESTS